MNNPYLIERLVELKMQEVQREAEQARLPREAGLSGPSLLGGAAQALRNLFAAWRGRLQSHHSVEPSASEEATFKTYPFTKGDQNI